jgi:hypothetical protein
MTRIKGIRYALTIAGEQLGSNTALIMDIYQQQLQQARPLRIHSIRIRLIGARFKESLSTRSWVCVTAAMVTSFVLTRGPSRAILF